MPEMMDGMSMDLERANMDKLRSVFPECFAEGKLDIDKLLSLCGEYISNDFEKYKFEWKGKAECLKLAQKRSTGTLRPCPEESVDWDTTQNLYIEGDNLEVLKLLQTAYYRKVKMIYIDPPYNTGNDFVYADDFADPMARYKEITQQTTKSNPETMGRFHTNWLNMMYPRLRLAANLLRDDGVIFISIDDNEVHNLRKICDEVFGEENFIADIIWQKVFSPKNTAQYFSVDHDYILCYARQATVWRPNLLPRSEEADNRYKNPDNDPRGPWTSGDVAARNYYGAGDYPITCPSGRVISGPPTGEYWRVSKEKFAELDADNRIWWGENGDNMPRLKRFLSEVQQGVVPQTLWFYKDVGHTQEAKKELLANVVFSKSENVFNTPKPTRLIKRIMQIATSSDENDIIMDFFSGSATTAHAVMGLNAGDSGNRHFIMVQIPEKTENEDYTNLCEIGKERIRRAGKKLMETDGQMQIGDEDKKPLDIGFRVFKLDTSNLQTWDSTPVDELHLDDLVDRMNSMVNRVKADRTDLDMVYEIMLKLGVPLTSTVSQVALNGKTAYTISGSSFLLVCLAANISPDDVDAMAAYCPKKVIISRDSFTNDTAVANAYYILRDKGIELKLV